MSGRQPTLPPGSNTPAAPPPAMGSSEEPSFCLFFAQAAIQKHCPGSSKIKIRRPAPALVKVTYKPASDKFLKSLFGGN